ncbi:NADH-quinone oxidoreductase subunit C/D [Buchnera aphidicola]|jgi:NADH-quinone oxidoreductase subunit C/D|uniref:NADH-quinone oxidoreductase subunit C/D n=1 Tax=Buchnera aphidicola subsp. Schizaphis graminum (strain Sg) TaxID=198804 RepID=NUOCD_BUCAP|nr:NADH-quinone oxidoreductase subunit C/D [Buchnera aphidicola]Q8K9Y5.1 RecName: Full=NADH-quinone oxidoreductase subunit C/D; AltName: Full=NADH dehydrogenase I subunit C/D; AltName: Full=NDH-1 subunit C/D [Buchnera aphidicola str. Sg (Schizaphis graminum)]AAM67717.1 NADH dehydrogenase I chain C, chain D [Buchnera aphidicola str. Sg (Schizaphis graminum)]AWI49787.1 NADH-quinone oxidoreductase subunit C/D [Buchnera aphidicola (Schizaphis graminum)]
MIDENKKKNTNLNKNEYEEKSILKDLFHFFGKDFCVVQDTCIDFPVIWINKSLLLKVGKFLSSSPKPYNMLFDLHGVDERFRLNRLNLPEADFSIFYHLISIERNSDILIKVPLLKDDLNVSTFISLFPNANWYERETWEMFGIIFDQHPNLTHIIMPNEWKGFPLRKDYPARATEHESFFLDEQKEDLEMENLRFKPELWGMKRKNDNVDFMFLNLGPNHPSAHGAFRIVLQLDGENIVDCVPDIGYHHRGAEKMAERQSWHSYIPYTDRIEYLGGCVNEMPYVLAVEKLANISVPEKVEVIRVMLSELFRINSHLLYISTFIQDVGCMTPVFLAFTDRQKIYDLIEAITGARMHPAWFRIGGVAHDLPKGWNVLLKEFLEWMPKRLKYYVQLALENPILIRRSKGIAQYNQKEALQWGVTGSGLRSTGLDLDVRKWRPYSGYQNYTFEIPIGQGISDCYSRVIIKVEEIYQSLSILKQCLKNMPEGPFKSDHPLTTPPPKERVLKDIDTMITHFLQVSWGPVIPANESFQMIEATKGINSYYLISDGGTMSYRTRIRTPSFPHLQQIPSVIRGSLISDLIVYLGSIDFVMSDVDR